MAAALIRAATVADAAAIREIYGSRHPRPGQLRIDVPSLDEVERRVTSVLAAGYPYVVASEGERVCGYAYASAFRTCLAYRSTVEDSVYLAPDAAGRGTGRLPLTRLLELCTALDFRQMIAVIGDSANAASIGLHRACGFNRMAVFAATGFKHGRWVDTVLMQRELGDGARSLPTA